MKKTKRAVQKLVPFKLGLAVVNRSKTDPELPDRILILPLCSICRKPITDFDQAHIFTPLTRNTRTSGLRRIGTIGDDQHPLLRDPNRLYVGHNECCQQSEANGSLHMFFCKRLSSILKSDQRDARDLACERAGL
jgi:hypothetical protein